jgi:hypothetical protein
MFKSTENKLKELLADYKSTLLEDAEFMSKLGKAVETARAVEVSKMRERKLEEFTEKELEMENSAEPWCDMMVIGVDDTRGVAIRTGWNTAFIKYLKENGFTGEDEEAIVQHWIGRLGIETMLDDYD